MTARAASSVIEFPRIRARAPSAREPQERSAQVLIFTGVRIERLPDDGEPAPRA